MVRRSAAKLARCRNLGILAPICRVPKECGEPPATRPRADAPASVDALSASRPVEAALHRSSSLRRSPAPRVPLTRGKSDTHRPVSWLAGHRVKHTFPEPRGFQWLRLGK